MKYNYNLPKTSIHTTPATRGNEITERYYWFLVGEINRGTMMKAVCRVENVIFGVFSYHLISL